MEDIKYYKVTKSINREEWNPGDYAENEYARVYFRIAVANCLQYNTSDGHYGLMDKLGNAITPPLYISINAIAANRYQCEAVYGSVIVDDAGKECGVKPQ